MARNSRYKSSERSACKTIAILTATAIFATTVVGGGTYYAISEIGREKLDVAYCYDRDDQYTVTAWIDFSHTSNENVSKSQDRDLLNMLKLLFDGLEVNGKLLVFNSSADLASSLPTPAFEICRPAKTIAEQEAIGGPAEIFTVLQKNSENAEKLFEKNLAAIIADAKDEEKKATSSPIISQLRGISAYRYDAPLNKIVVFSDAMENSDENGTFCSDEGDLKTFEEYATRSDYPHLRLKDISSVEVDFFMVQFGALPNNAYPHCESYQELYDFYEGLFLDAGAKEVNFTPLGFGAG